MAYAHAVIVDPRTDRRYERGQEVPDDLPGIAELRDAGSVSDDVYTEPDPVAQGAIAAVLTPEDFLGLTKSTREELERRGLIANHVDGSDEGQAGEASA